MASKMDVVRLRTSPCEARARPSGMTGHQHVAQRRGTTVEMRQVRVHVVNVSLATHRLVNPEDYVYADNWSVE